MEKSEMLKEVELSANSRPWWGELLVFVIVVFTASILESWIQIVSIAIGVAIEGGDFNTFLEYITLQKPSPIWSQIVLLFGCIAITLSASVYCIFIEKRSYLSIGFSRKGVFKEYVVGILVGVGMFSIVIILIGLICGCDVEVNITGSPLLLVSIFFIGFMIQGMSEEVLCRGYLMNSLTKRYSIPFAIIISSVVFSLLHGGNPGVSIIALINIALFGAFLSIYMLRRGSIWGVCAIHAAWNFVQGNVFGVSVSGMDPLPSVTYVQLHDASNLITGGDFGVEGSIISTLILSISCYLSYRMKQQA